RRSGIRQRLMAPVAHRLFAGALAGTEPGFFRGGGLVFHWREAGALVRAVAERLRFGAPAGAPPIALAALELDRDRPPAADLGHCADVAHFALPASFSDFPPPSVASHASPHALASSRTRRI